MLIQFKDVTVVREGREILSNLNGQLSEHRIGILGSNGSGKSTLLRLINGLQLPSRGQVIVDGSDVAQSLSQVRRRVGFVFQNPDHQLILPVVNEDIELGLKRLIPDRTARALRVQEVLDQLACGSLSDRVIHSLSGGERQLVALASVLAVNPSILVFDEPTTQLDLKNARRFTALLLTLAQPSIVVSHDLDLMAQMDRVLVIDQGRIVQDADAGSAIAWYRDYCAHQA